MNTDEQTFLSAIRGRYWDESPRLIFADWLDEQGQPERAEFVRVQVELQNLPAYDPRRPELAVRERTLLNEFSRDWAAPLLELGAQTVSFSGGVIEGMTISAGAFLQGRLEFFRRCRTLRIAAISLHNAPFARLLESGLLAFLTELTLADARLTDRSLELLAGSPHVARLIALHLPNNDFGRRGLTALAQSVRMPELRLLDLSRNRLNREAIDVLPGGKLTRLSRLVLADNQLDQAGLWSLLERVPQTALKSLNVADNVIRLRHSRVRFPNGLAKLEALRLGGNLVGDAMAVSLADSRHAANLQRLDLQRTGVGPDGARALAESPHLGKLVELNLSGNTIRRDSQPAWRTVIADWFVGPPSPEPTTVYADLRARFGDGVKF